MQRRLIFLLLLGHVATAIAEDAKETTVRALCDRSNQVSGLTFPSPQPFAIKIRVEILKTFANPAMEGTVAFMDTGTFWREDLRLPDYGVSSIGDGKKTWTKRSTEIAPGLVHDTLRLVNGSPSMRPFPNTAVRNKPKEIKKKTVRNRAVTCIESSAKFESCFDDATGATVSQSDDHARWEYEDFQEFHGKLVPRRMEYFWDNTLLIRATVAALEVVVPDPKLFVAGNDYKEEDDSCAGQVTPPKLVHTVDPDYPPGYRGQNVETVLVRLRIKIAADGTVKDAIVTNTAGNDFDKEALKVIRAWRFEPAKCDGKPYSREITVQMNFHP